MDRQDMIVMITGANRGIGAAIADKLYEEGARLSLGVRAPEQLRGRYEPARCLLTKVDVRSEEQLAHYARETFERFGAVHVLVNNAGVDEPRPLDEISLDHLHEVMTVNFYSAVLLTKLVRPLMASQKWGRVINVSSIAGKEGTPHHVAYTASKHAVLGFTKSVARELIREGITVNAVCPGLIETDMLRDFFAQYAKQIGGSSEAELGAMVSRTPLGRIGDPRDVAALVSFLASEQARNIVGQAINTDGGLLQW